MSCLLVFVSGSSVKMAAVPVWAPLLPIQPKPKVWNRLHLILNTWQQLERRKGERRKKFFKKEKQSGFVNELPPNSPLPSSTLCPLPLFSLCLFFPRHFLVTPESSETIVSTCLSCCQRRRHRRRLLMPFYPSYKVSVPLTGHEMKEETYKK